MMKQYYKFVAEKISDTVAKATMKYLIMELETKLLVTLVEQLLNETLLPSLFEEEKTITEKRCDATKKLKVCILLNFYKDQKTFISILSNSMSLSLI